MSFLTEVLRGRLGRSSGVPKLIHSAWLQGRDAAPAVVRLNHARWAELNPGHRLQVWEQARVQRLLEPYGLAIDGMAPQALSDILRVRLLLQYGGVWADASLFPVLPLDDWLPDATRRSGFFAFERPWADRLISSWFLAAGPGHPIVKAWWREIVGYWSRPRRLIGGIPDDPLASVAHPDDGGDATYPYFWVHYLFERVVTSPTAAGRSFQMGDHRSAVPCRSLREAMAAGGMEAEALRRIAHQAPVQKLDWRGAYPLDALAALPAK